MKKVKILGIALFAAALFVGNSSFAQDGKMKDEKMKEKTVMVGGAAMCPSKNIAENASQSADHTTLVAAVKAAGLVDTLAGEGPFTVFAPTNAAFDALPEGTVASLLEPENKEQLAGILTYHVVAGNYSAKDVKKLVTANNNKAIVPTVSGSTITLSMDDGKVYVTDTSGNTAQVIIADVDQSNGVIHVVDGVLLPKG
ncbi:fasciclin domain-containing protein [Nonlabens xiamenensis]|uniref:fasciclin domain-containing protein n=1 Tax=Nonlabens xiamenensis TaxID=2341043 RepID=UPI000F605B68|nr:fasciclin domain-containing protein [Nonlabens xiamenensis]